MLLRLPLRATLGLQKKAWFGRFRVTEIQVPYQFLKTFFKEVRMILEKDELGFSNGWTSTAINDRVFLSFASMTVLNGALGVAQMTSRYAFFCFVHHLFQRRNLFLRRGFL